jgi:transcriptional regulator with XRE-family HTH domain
MPHSAALEFVHDLDATASEEPLPEQPLRDERLPEDPLPVVATPPTRAPSVTVAEQTLTVPTAAVPDRTPAVPGPVPERLKAGRIKRGLSVRGLARQVGVSPSLVSQIENGKANPSVGTLYAIVSALDISLDLLFDRGVVEPVVEPVAVRDLSGLPTSAVMRADERPSLTLDSGVQWDRLTPDSDGAVDFLQITYDVGAASCPEDALLRHNGREYGLVLSGRLGATVGFDSYELGPGDSITIDSATPHRLWTIGDQPAKAVWTVLGRDGSAPERLRPPT